MGFFDKLKENVNKAVDIDKLKEMASKTVDSVKHEVAKAVDPSVKEQERLEKERQKEEAVSAFFSSIDLDQEMNYILDVLQNSVATASNFEKGVELMLSKNGATFTKEDVLPAMKKELFARTFGEPWSAVAEYILTEYFISDIINKKLLALIKNFVVSKRCTDPTALEKMRNPFLQTLYGIAGRVANYHNTFMKQGTYTSMAPDDFIGIIENSNELKYYTDQDPFKANEVRAAWTPKLYNLPLEILEVNNWNGLLNEEKQIDAMYYYAYTRICKEDSAGQFSVAIVSSVLLDYAEELLKQYEKAQGISR